MTELFDVRSELVLDTDLESRQMRFCACVGSLLREAVERTNAHLAKGSEKWQLCEVSGYFTGPLHVGRAACNPIAYELRQGSRVLGDPLIVELTGDGTVEVSIGLLRTAGAGAHRIGMGPRWAPVSLDMFNAQVAADIVAGYVSAVATQSRSGVTL
jgi:hypothetical protein